MVSRESQYCKMKLNSVHFIEFRYNRCNFRIRLNAEKQVPQVRKNNFSEKVIEVRSASHLIRIKLTLTEFCERGLVFRLADEAFSF